MSHASSYTDDLAANVAQASAVYYHALCLMCMVNFKEFIVHDIA
jgi:hypothetical protein